MMAREAHTSITQKFLVKKIGFHRCVETRLNSLNNEQYYPINNGSRCSVESPCGRSTVEPNEIANVSEIGEIHNACQ